MSSRCTVAYTRKLHIYSCCNSDWEIFLADSICDEAREGYNSDIKLSHDELRDLYLQLKDYFDKGASFEKYSKGEPG